MYKYYCLGISGVKDGEEAICTHFIWNDDEKALKKGEFTIKNGLFIVNFDDGVGGIENFKNWLKCEKEKGTPVSINYVLKEPIVREIKDFDVYESIFKSDEYDIEEIAMTYKLDSFIFFKCNLPYYLQISNGIYCIETDVELSENINNKKRKIIYCIYRKCIKNQKVPSKSGNFEYDPNTQEYSFFTTNIDVMVETDDHNMVNHMFRENQNELIRIVQSSLEILATKYNEALAGKDFWNPFVEETGAQRMVYLVMNNINNKYEVKEGIVSPGLCINSIEEIENKKIEETINQAYNIWRYFFNKAKYCFENYNNLDCIICSAICIEAYIYNIVKTNNLIIEFEEYQKLHNRKGSSLFHLTEFLKYKDFFTKEEEDFVNSAFGNINKIRNEIVHGKIITPIMSREKAKNAKEGAISIIKRFEKTV